MKKNCSLLTHLLRLVENSRFVCLFSQRNCFEVGPCLGLFKKIILWRLALLVIRTQLLQYSRRIDGG